jgi:hypothetical protein
MKFTQPVSMQCSEEQYNRDLRESLLAMGYNERNISNFSSYPMLVTNQGGGNSRLANLDYFNKLSYGRYFIEGYNPELFLALAGMTDSEIGNVGEWWTCFNHDSSGFKKGISYKQISNHIEHGLSLLDEENEPNGRTNARLNFEKATKEELINQFTITKMKTITVNKTDAKKLYDLACDNWKRKMDEYLKPFMFQDTIDFSEGLVKEMQLACTPEQLPVFKEIFGDLDKNAFVGKFDGNEIQSTAIKLFGKNKVKITRDSAYDIDRADLSGRSLYFTSDVEVITHKTPNGGTIIEVKNK